ncbi:hypothetical protein PZB74_10720 [Porifericola rhodea]|uniref:hypothetical protein n=1 Tax=Porifericola rhodea TaxID=930972 RepID=UPI002666523B|nr:hypothetical protein [Porifericola rhodea]WKN33796.1 hypothetical protein PZB74_10720 [Porifericola rhodea]
MLDIILLAFLLIIIAVTVYALSSSRNKFHNPHVIINIPTTIGILGTFVGITVGLHGFDVNDIQASVPVLLSGLKTAFWTSIAGMAATLLLRYKFRHGNRPKVIDYRTDNIINLLSSINDGLSSDKEQSLKRQMQSLRFENANNFDVLNESINKFADKIVENSIEQLIEALAAVMEDFNSKINDRLTTSIDQLNNSTKNLIEWQSNYSYQIENMNNQFTNSLNGINEAKLILADISKKSEVYYNSANEMDKLLKVLNINLEALDGVAKNSKELLPTIEKKIEQLTSSFSEAVKRSVNENNIMFEHQKEAINAQINTFEKSYREIGDLQQKQVKEVTTSIEKLMIKNSDRIDTQIKNLDEELAKQLNKVLDDLGSKLASVTEHVLNNYIKISDHLNSVGQTLNTRN